MEEKVLELNKRTIKLLERTKKYYTKYEKERKILDNFLRNPNNLIEWETFLNNFENLLNLDD